MKYRKRSSFLWSDIPQTTKRKDLTKVNGGNENERKES